MTDTQMPPEAATQMPVETSTRWRPPPSPAIIHAVDARADARRTNTDRLRRLLESAGLADVVEDGALVAIKMSFGERGNVGYVHPVYVRTVVDAVKEHGGRPVLMDSNTLYAGSRRDAHDSLVTALQNGFSFATVGAPVVILDGLTGKDYREVPIGGRIYQRVKIGTGLLDADALISLAHFKGHMLGGFGGQIKNLAMGGAPRSGKQMMHSDVKPMVDPATCTACTRCVRWCPEGAISMVEAAGSAGGAARRTATIDGGRCIGCGECVATCVDGAIRINFDADAARVQEKMAEFALGALAGKNSRFLGVNVALHITPDCDCAGWSDAPVVPDLGILASTDPLALDQAAYDLCNALPGISGSALDETGLTAPDKFAFVHNVDPTVQLTHGEAVGLGARAYEVVWR